MIHYSIELCNKALDSLTLGGKDRYAVEVERDSLLQLEDDIKLLLPAQPEQQMKCDGCRYDNHASGWSEYCVLCKRNYLSFKDRYKE